jgi:L-asparaginase
VGEIWNAEFFSKLDAWILVVFTSGTGPTENPAFMKAIRQATMVRIPVILVTEEGFFPKASNEQSLVSVYEAGRKLEKSGCLWARRMTVECAYVKAALILGQNQGARNFAKLWSRSLAGEC